LPQIFLGLYLKNPKINLPAGRGRRNMFVYKCDICKKEINQDRKEISVTPPGKLSAFMFCEKCGKPVLVFLKKHKLLKE